MPLLPGSKAYKDIHHTLANDGADPIFWLCTFDAISRGRGFACKRWQEMHNSDYISARDIFPNKPLLHPCI